MARRQNWCAKQKHATKADAMAAAVAAKKGRRRGSMRGLKRDKKYLGVGAKIRTYKCQVCGFFHWTHYIKGAKRDNRKKL